MGIISFYSYCFSRNIDTYLKIKPKHHTQTRLTILNEVNVPVNKKLIGRKSICIVYVNLLRYLNIDAFLVQHKSLFLRCINNLDLNNLRVYFKSILPMWLHINWNLIVPNTFVMLA